MRKILFFFFVVLVVMLLSLSPPVATNSLIIANNNNNTLLNGQNQTALGLGGNIAATANQDATRRNFVKSNLTTPS